MLTFVSLISINPASLLQKHCARQSSDKIWQRLAFLDLRSNLSSTLAPDARRRGILNVYHAPKSGRRSQHAGTELLHLLWLVTPWLVDWCNEQIGIRYAIICNHHESVLLALAIHAWQLQCAWSYRKGTMHLSGSGLVHLKQPLYVVPPPPPPPSPFPSCSSSPSAARTWQPAIYGSQNMCNKRSENYYHAFSKFARCHHEPLPELFLLILLSLLSHNSFWWLERDQSRYCIIKVS